MVGRTRNPSKLLARIKITPVDCGCTRTTVARPIGRSVQDEEGLCEIGAVVGRAAGRQHIAPSAGGTMTYLRSASRTAATRSSLARCGPQWRLVTEAVGEGCGVAVDEGGRVEVHASGVDQVLNELEGLGRHLDVGDVVERGLDPHLCRTAEGGREQAAPGRLDHDAALVIGHQQHPERDDAAGSTWPGGRQTRWSAPARRRRATYSCSSIL